MPQISDFSIPRKIESFHSFPILNVCSGGNHSLALALWDSKHYMLFAWGMPYILFAGAIFLNKLF